MKRYVKSGLIVADLTNVMIFRCNDFSLNRNTRNCRIRVESSLGLVVSYNVSLFGVNRKTKKIEVLTLRFI